MNAWAYMYAIASVLPARWSGDSLVDPVVNVQLTERLIQLFFNIHTLYLWKGKTIAHSL